MRRTVLYTSLALRFVVRAMSTSSKRAAIAQLTATNNKYFNLINVAHCAALAKKQGACMLFLPECFGFIGSSSAETIRNAEVLEDGGNEGTPTKYNTPEVSSALESTVNGDGKIAPKDQQNSEEAKNNDAISLMHGLKTIAQASNLWISGGGIHEVVADQENRVYNTHVILNNEGALMQKYRKIHLFDVSIPSRGVELKESNTTLAGNSIEVCPSPLGMLGLSTCYDMRFPEQYTELVKRGAQIMLAPSAFTVPTGTAHWHVLLRGKFLRDMMLLVEGKAF